MRVLLLPMIIAVLVSLAVVALAASVSPEGQGFRAFFRDLRSGLSARFGAGRESEGAADELEPVDTSLDDFFAATATDEDPYFAADRLANRIEHVVDATRSRSHS